MDWFDKTNNCRPKHCICLCGMALHLLAWHGMAWHGIAWYGFAFECMHRVGENVVQQLLSGIEGFIRTKPNFDDGHH